MTAIAIFAFLVALLPPPPYAPPDLTSCSLSHGFAIGEAPAFPGTVEIWNCPGQTIVALNQMSGSGENRAAAIRSHLSPGAGPGERLMGCRGKDENFDGTIALAAGAQLRRAWKADLEKWEFVSTSPVDLVCNRGLTAD